MKWSIGSILVLLLVVGCEAGPRGTGEEVVEYGASEYTLEQVLERHRQAMGAADVLTKADTEVKTGSINAPEFSDAPVTTIIHDGKGYLRRIERANGDTQLGWDGTTAWQKGARMDTQDVLIMSSKESRLYSVLADIAGPLLSAAERGYALELLGTSETGEQVVQVTVPNLGDRLYFLDGESFLLSRLVEHREPLGPRDPPLRVVTRYGRYQAVDGAMRPFFEQTTIPDLEFEQSLTWDEIKLNVEVDDAVFEIPES